jgi:AcrR family transcriptional regulator
VSDTTDATVPPPGDADGVKRGPGRPADPGIIERRRRELVEAAYRVFARKGYAATGVADIVEELGVGRGTFYRYFDNKRDILLSALDYGADRMISAMSDGDVGVPALIRAGATAENLLDYARGVLDRLYTILEREPGLARVVLFELSGVDDELTQRLLSLNDLAAKSVEVALRRGVELGLVRPDLDAEMAARLINTAIFPGVVESLRGELTPPRRRRFVDTAVRMMRSGVFVHAGD